MIRKFNVYINLLPYYTGRQTLKPLLVQVSRPSRNLVHNHTLKDRRCPGDAHKIGRVATKTSSWANEFNSGPWLDKSRRLTLKGRMSQLDSWTACLRTNLHTINEDRTHYHTDYPILVCWPWPNNSDNGITLVCPQSKNLSKYATSCHNTVVTYQKAKGFV